MPTNLNPASWPSTPWSRAVPFGALLRVDGAGHFLLACDHTANQTACPEEVAAIGGLLRRILRPRATWSNRAGRIATSDRTTFSSSLRTTPRSALSLLPLGVTRVGTVDNFQGQEAPIVIDSCTSSSPEDAPRGLAFLYDPHRLNVASSRAQGVFVMMASPRLFSPKVRTPEQMRWADGMCRFREVAQVLRLEAKAQ